MVCAICCRVVTNYTTQNATEPGVHNSFPKGGGIKDLIQGIKSKKREEGKEREKGRRKRKKSA